MKAQYGLFLTLGNQSFCFCPTNYRIFIFEKQFQHINLKLYVVIYVNKHGMNLAIPLIGNC